MSDISHQISDIRYVFDSSLFRLSAVPTFVKPPPSRSARQPLPREGARRRGGRLTLTSDGSFAYSFFAFSA